MQEPLGGINPFRSYYGVKQPLRFHTSVGNAFDEQAQYRHLRERPQQQLDPRRLTILLVGEMGRSSASKKAAGRSWPTCRAWRPGQLGAVRAAAWGERARFTFDHHAPGLLRFFRQVIDRAAGAGGPATVDPPAALPVLAALRPAAPRVQQDRPRAGA